MTKRHTLELKRQTQCGRAQPPIAVPVGAVWQRPATKIRSQWHASYREISVYQIILGTETDRCRKRLKRYNLWFVDCRMVG